MPLPLAALLIFVVAAASTYVALNYTLSQLVGPVIQLNLLLYPAGLFCWLMPLKWRQAYLAAFLFNLAWYMPDGLRHICAAPQKCSIWLFYPGQYLMEFSLLTSS